jgi:cytochrome c-type biogenesis protein
LGVTPDVSYLAAFGGGLVSFLSPCVLPIVPAYLSLVTGLDVAEVREGGARHAARIVGHTSLFIAGFSAVFIVLGSSATAFGQATFRNRAVLTRLSGLVLLAMALFVLGSLFLKLPWL